MKKYFLTQLSICFIGNCFAQSYKHQVGKISYEIKNHLGSVSAVANDVKNYNLVTNKKTANVKLVSNYDAFGAEAAGRVYASSSYRYGYNGKEKDNELKGNGNSLDYGARIYDPRIGRWLSNDPLQSKFAGLSPYNYCFNNPIKFIDPDGKEPKTPICGENGVTEGCLHPPSFWRDKNLESYQNWCLTGAFVAASFVPVLRIARIAQIGRSVDVFVVVRGINVGIRPIATAVFKSHLLQGFKDAASSLVDSYVGATLEGKGIGDVDVADAAISGTAGLITGPEAHAAVPFVSGLVESAVDIKGGTTEIAFLNKKNDDVKKDAATAIIMATVGVKTEKLKNVKKGLFKYIVPRLEGVIEAGIGKGIENALKQADKVDDAVQNSETFTPTYGDGLIGPPTPDDWYDRPCYENCIE